ncbi:MAG: ubiquinone/menaquinone biosynthesis methyltransferase [candidate division Zixibacteria bacterium]|nr:ubiquinone/menaquinone biosynthesis methyltransferase [candidate division Zixibacteria bacterium]
MNKGLQKIYSEIPKRYELINHLITFGADIRCRKHATKIALEGAEGNNGSGATWVDMCSGTGETVVNLSKKAGENTTLIAADFSLPMLNIARQKPETKNVKFVLTDARHLPFADNSIDLITISFATRNLNTNREILISTFAEFQRVLKPSGRFINLETSQPPNWFFRKLMYLFVGITVRRIGAALSGNKAGYAYLSHSIPRFYTADELSKILNEAGFSDVSYKRLYFGFMAIHHSKM